MNEKIILYHGSSKIIKKPIYGVGNPQNDYGLGFYCTENIELAKEWACSPDGDGYANEYELDMSQLTTLSLTSGDYNILNWLAILLENRRFRIDGVVAKQAYSYISENFHIEYRNYDIVRGYRADDSYFAFASAFLNNTISLGQLERSMTLGRLGEQVVALSEKAFDAFVYRGSVLAEKEHYLPKKLERDSLARKAFKDEKSKDIILDEKYILDIMRERWRSDDERIQRVILK